ncbi:hypothetical protein [Litoreibacter roseus]|uniref:Uncharacterized protein n=1 Tax=Litoreibacter roseus TaxID=2601869 RepID=A0A6N6JD79_9RHOB|nr:hypothetical protein [Litoreibacter roseus]GFE63152.1 hypothetical protein KIN_02260 [Litoreibacter roseus]
MIGLSASLLAVLSAPALAQTGPPLDLEMHLDPVTHENRFEAVVIERNGIAVRLTTDTWLRPKVTGYAQAAAPIVVALGVPAGPNVPVTRNVAVTEGLPDIPVPGGDRAALVTDDLANSMLLNIADDLDGLTLAFPDGLVNGPGPDILIAKASLPSGRISGGCPGVPASGADAMVISVTAGGEITLAPEAFIDFGPAGPQLNHGTRELGEAEFRIETLTQLAELEMRPLATIEYFKVYATTVNLSDLGIAEGASVETITLSSTREMVETDNGQQLCWTADPILVVGLGAV